MPSEKGAEAKPAAPAKKTATKKATTKKKAVKKSVAEKKPAGEQKAAKKKVAKKTTTKKKTTASSAKRVRIRQVKSGVGSPMTVRRTLTALGLKHHQDEVTLPDNSSVRGMIGRVHHLVSVTSEES